jgi:hypothetical protein
MGWKDSPLADQPSSSKWQNSPLAEDNPSAQASPPQSITSSRSQRDSRIDSLIHGWQDPFVGLAQLGEMIPGVPTLRNWTGSLFGLPKMGPKAASSLSNEREEQLDALRAQDSRSGFDAYRMLGNLAQPLNYVFNALPGAGPAASNIAAKQGIWEAMKAAAPYGAKIGLGTALMQPVTNAPTDETSDLAKEKVLQALMGTVAGGVSSSAVTGSGRLFGKAKEGIRNLYIPWTKEGYKEIAAQSDLHAIPEAQRQSVIAQAQQAQPTIPNAPITVAESLQKATPANPYGHPGGGTLQEIQDLTMKTPGDPASIGHAIKTQSLAAQADKLAAIKAETDPLRVQALDAIRQRNGIRANELLKPIRDLLKTEEVQGAPGSKKAIESIVKTLTSYKDPYGRISGDRLYSFEKEGVNQIIDDAFNQADPSQKVKFRALNLQKIKDIIYDAMEKGGGGQAWRDYLSKYSSGMKQLELEQYMKGVALDKSEPMGYAQSSPGMYKSLQKVSSGYGLATPGMQEIGVKGPPLLNRYYAIAKYLPEARAKFLEPQIDAYRAQLYQNAPAWSDAMNTQVQANAQRQAIIDALVKKGLMTAPIAAGTSQ